MEALLAPLLLPLVTAQLLLGGTVCPVGAGDLVLPAEGLVLKYELEPERLTPVLIWTQPAAAHPGRALCFRGITGENA